MGGKLQSLEKALQIDQRWAFISWASTLPPPWTRHRANPPRWDQARWRWIVADHKPSWTPAAELWQMSRRRTAQGTCKTAGGTAAAAAPHLPGRAENGNGPSPNRAQRAAGVALSCRRAGARQSRDSVVGHVSDATPLHLDRWVTRGKQAGWRRLQHIRRLERAGQDIPPHLRPQRWDVKALKGVSSHPGKGARAPAPRGATRACKRQRKKQQGHGSECKGARPLSGQAREQGACCGRAGPRTGAWVRSGARAGRHRRGPGDGGGRGGRGAGAISGRTHASSSGEGGGGSPGRRRSGSCGFRLRRGLRAVTDLSRGGEG